MSERQMGYRTKICIGCGAEYQPTGSCQRFCVKCTWRAASEWRAAHPGYDARHAAALRLAHPDFNKKWNATWAATHPGASAERWDKWYAAHPGAKAADWAIWKANNQGKMTVYQRKAEAKRRAFGFHPLNKFFEGSDAHHLNQSDVVYIPQELHRSVWHSQTTGQGMEQINALAMTWLTSESIQ